MTTRVHILTDDERELFESTRVTDRCAFRSDLHSALVVIDRHLDAIAQRPAIWGGALAAEMLAAELLVVRSVLCGAEPAWHGGEALARAKQRRFGSCNGPVTNFVKGDALVAASDMLAIAVKAERKRMGVPSQCPRRKGGVR